MATGQPDFTRAYPCPPTEAPGPDDQPRSSRAVDARAAGRPDADRALAGFPAGRPDAGPALAGFPAGSACTGPRPERDRRRYAWMYDDEDIWGADGAGCVPPVIDGDAWRAPRM
jgi:hypothetical protein